MGFNFMGVSQCFSRMNGGGVGWRCEGGVALRSPTSDNLDHRVTQKVGGGGSDVRREDTYRGAWGWRGWGSSLVWSPTDDHEGGVG